MIEMMIIFAYLALLLILGIFASRLFRGTSQDYMLASHSIGPFLLLMSLFGTTMTAFALVGSTGEAYKEGIGVYGMLASSSGIIHSLCFFLLGVKLWTFGRKYGYTTQIQYFRDRLDSDKIGLLLFPILVSLVIPYLLIGVMASGVVMNSVTEGAFTSTFAEYDYGLPPWIGSLIICVVVLIYVFFGGMRGTAWANTFQTAVFMVLGIITFWIISSKLGGVDAASDAVAERNPSKLMRSVAPADEERYEKDYAAWQTLAQYNFATQDAKLFTLSPEQTKTAYDEFKPRMPNWQKRAEAVYAKKNGLLNDLSIAQKNEALVLQDDRQLPEPRPEWWDTVLLDHESLEQYPRDEAAQFNAYEMYGANIGHPAEDLDPENPAAGKKWTRKKATGVYRATKWAPEAPVGTDPWQFLTYIFVPLSVGMFPHLFQHWLTAKSASSFKLPVVAHPVFIMIVWVPCVLVGVWATSAVIDGKPLFPPHFPANAVLPAMVKQMTSPVLTGLLSAGILAAIMSSLDSQFLCLGTMFTEDVMVHYGGKGRYTDRQVVIMARTFIILIVALTYFFSLYEPRRVFQLGVWTFSGFSSLFPLVFASLYWKRLTKPGAYACILTAISLWTFLFWKSDFAAIANFSINFGGENLIGVTQPGQRIETGVIQTQPVMVMVLGSALIMVLVSLVTKPPRKEVVGRFFPEESE
ncbi:sodium:solute symporter family protein [bacterium]|uniref:Na+/solute symporter n=1 Tax=Rubinisphaera brasiliensis (strain ATCC 49424 / DSM 5305 / JCM 21570 / IAM 15109 / NBRC 103401 / IFAM 1448) TaxID=756272 RepID=F0SLY4_RUBBR|nr:sodium:solute symporter family protein [Rubinisphaera brasiliensis]ADY59909.1 Na+/solute symporter [Rubinisphaera brasiliensis DSM 5305]MBR9802864.1 sodium:solute symporter family protein [bacterium]